MPPAAGQLICRRRIDLRGEPAHNTSGSFFRAEFAAGGHFVAADAAGNIVIVGSFLGLVDFGAGELDTKGADWALFVAKFDGSCRPLWSRSFGSPGARIEGAPLAIDGEGAIVVAGALFGSADFGGAEETSASSHYNAYVLKLSADGDTLWSKVLESQGLSYAYSVAVDASDDVVITGEGEADTDFDDATLGTGGPFAAELSPSGKHLWTTRLPSALEGSWVSTSTAGDVMLTSALAGPVDWADGTASIPGSGEHSVLSQLSAAGVHRFSKAVHEGGAGWGFGFAPASGDRFILTYDLPAATQTSDRRAADTLAADGTLLSSRAWDGAAGTRTQAVALDASGNAIELGVFAGSVTFGATTLTSIASEDVYLAKRDQYGALVWASHEPSEMQRENVGLGVDVDSNDNTLAFWLGRESDGEAGDELMLVKLAP